MSADHRRPKTSRPSSSRGSQKIQLTQNNLQSELDLQQKIIINRLIKELANEKSIDIATVLHKPHIHRIFKDEFSMTDREIRDLEKIIVKNCDSIINNFVQTDTLIPLKNSNATLMNQQTKQQPLSLLQRKEIDHYQELDYSKYPAQPCVRSLYYISKIAQTQQIKILVPPSILIGFGDDNRMMHNDPQNGSLIVKTGYISPKLIQQFIQKHMIYDQLEQTVEDRILFPKFVIKLASKTHTKNDIRVYYSKDSLIGDLMSFWGTYDMAIQQFVKQKHLRPSIYRYYMKNGNVYKAVSISNQENLTKDTRMYKNLLGMVFDQFQKTKKSASQRPKSSLNLRRRDGIITSHKSGLSNGGQGAFSKKLSLERIMNSNIQNHIEDSIDSRGFPSSLENFKLHEFHNEAQQQLSIHEVKKYFCCSTDNIDNLAMMNCRPGAQAQADKMTSDLFRLYSQYYLKTQKFGNVSHFVCDFIEAENGLTYLLQVKSFECEGLLHDWQVPWNPLKTKNLTSNQNTSPNNAGILRIEDDIELQNQQCQAKIICVENKFCPDLKEIFVSACKEAELWTFNNRKGQLPKFPLSTIEKYQKEIQQGKESFLLQSEKLRISPLFPLTTFSDQQKETSSKMNSPGKARQFSIFKHQQQQQKQQVDFSNQVTLSINVNQLERAKTPNKTPSHNNDHENPESLSQSNKKLQIESPPLEIRNESPCCFACSKVLDLFQS
eukprot:403375175